VKKRKEKGKVQHGGGGCGRRNERGENYYDWVGGGGVNREEVERSI
jgi:hypothetical protein